MNYETISFTGNYNSEGAPIFKGERKVENTFDITTLEKMIEQGKKQRDDVNNAILSAETNIELNKGIIGLIKEDKELTEKEIAGGKIYFESIKDLKAMKDYLPKVNEEIEKWEATLKTTKELNIPNAEITTGTGEGGEKTGPEVTDSKE